MPAPGRVCTAQATLCRYYVPGTHWHELPTTPQLHTGVNPGLQLFEETEHPIPSTLEHWQVPEPLPGPPPVPVPPPPEAPPHGHPQLQVTSDPAERTSAPEFGKKNWPGRNRPRPRAENSAVKPGIRMFVFIAMSFRDRSQQERGSISFLIPPCRKRIFNYPQQQEGGTKQPHPAVPRHVKSAQGQNFAHPPPTHRSPPFGSTTQLPQHLRPGGQHSGGGRGGLVQVWRHWSIWLLQSWLHRTHPVISQPKCHRQF